MSTSHSHTNSNSQSHPQPPPQNTTSTSTFPHQRALLLTEIATALDTTLTHLNRLNRSLESITAVGNEFGSVEALWSHIENVMGGSGERETTGNGGGGGGGGRKEGEGSEKGEGYDDGEEGEGEETEISMEEPVRR